MRPRSCTCATCWTPIGLTHGVVVVTAASVNNVTQAHALLHGQERDVLADAGYSGVDKREEVRPQPPEANGHVAMRPGKRRRLDKSRAFKASPDQIETVTVRYRGPEEGRCADCHAAEAGQLLDGSATSCAAHDRVSVPVRSACTLLGGHKSPGGGEKSLQRPPK